jgi:argininosuccinate lyase
MPQKKNFDSLELIRGKCGKLNGILTGFLTTMKGIPTSYNKDLQSDKEALFDSFDTTSSLIQIMSGVIETLKIDENKMKQSLSIDMLATDLAYYLVRKGMPFRQAHSVAGICVAEAEKRECSINELSIGELKNISHLFDQDDIQKVYNFEQSVEQYTSQGGTAKASIVEQINHYKNKLFN